MANHRITYSVGTQLYVSNFHWVNRSDNAYPSIFEIGCIIDSLTTGSGAKNYTSIPCLSHGKINILINPEYPEMSFNVVFDNSNGVHLKIFEEVENSKEDKEHTFCIADGDGTARPSSNRQKDGDDRLNHLIAPSERTSKLFIGSFIGAEIINENESFVKMNITIKRKSAMKLFNKDEINLDYWD